MRSPEIVAAPCPAEPPPPPKPRTAPRAPRRSATTGPAASIVTVPRRPTPALSLEQEISVLQQFGYTVRSGRSIGIMYFFGLLLTGIGLALAVVVLLRSGWST